MDQIPCVASDDKFLFAGTLGSSVWRMPIAQAGVHQLATTSNDVSIFPNPFSSIAKVQLNLAEHSQVRIELFDLLGRKLQDVADKDFAAGLHTIQIDGKNLPSGSYILVAHTLSNSGIDQESRQLIVRSK